MSDKPQNGVSGPQIVGNWDIPDPTQKSLFSIRYHKLIVKRINALLKMIAVPSKSNGPLIISDGNAQLPVAGTARATTTPTSSSSVSEFKFVAMNSVDMDCHTWDGSSEGITIIKVTKPYLLRFSIASRTVDGVTISYTSYSAANQSRTANNGTAVQTEKITPRYIPGDVIIAAQITDSTGAHYVDLNNDGRSFAGPG